MVESDILIDYEKSTIPDEISNHNDHEFSNCQIQRSILWHREPSKEITNIYKHNRDFSLLQRNIGPSIEKTLKPKS